MYIHICYRDYITRVALPRRSPNGNRKEQNIAVLNTSIQQNRRKCQNFFRISIQL